MGKTILAPIHGVCYRAGYRDPDHARDGESMIQIQIRYDEPNEKELAEFYQRRILEEHIGTIVPIVVVQRR